MPVITNEALNRKLIRTTTIRTKIIDKNVWKFHIYFITFKINANVEINKKCKLIESSRNSKPD